MNNFKDIDRHNHEKSIVLLARLKGTNEYHEIALGECSLYLNK